MDNVRGALLMTISMGAFAVEDALIKTAAQVMPTGQVIFVMAILGAGVFWGLSAARGGSVLTADLFAAPVLLRSAGEVIGTAGFILAITMAPLSVASAILTAAPLMVTLGAAIFMGERVGWRRWTAGWIGLVGVLMVIQPGLEGFEPAALFALLAVVGLVIRDLAVRWARPGLTSLQLAFSAYVWVAPMGLAMMSLMGDRPVAMGAGTALVMAAAGVFGCGGYWLVVHASRIGEVSFVTPFRHTRILFALAIGVIAFAERPNGLALAGIAVIFGAGLYTIWRERTLVRRPLAA